MSMTGFLKTGLMTGDFPKNDHILVMEVFVIKNVRLNLDPVFYNIELIRTLYD